MEMVELFNAVTLHTSPESLQHIGTLLSPHYTRNVGLQGSQRFWGEVRRYFRYTREPEVEAQKMSLPSWQDLRKLKIFIAFGPAVPLINIYPRKTFIHEHQKLWFVHFPFVMRVDLMLTVLTTTTPQKTQGNSGGIAYVYYLDCDDGITCVCICSNLANCTHQIYEGFNETLHWNYISVKLLKNFCKDLGSRSFFETSGT